MSQPIIEIKDLALSYGPERAVLNNVQLSLERNAVTAIIGASGSGKSSLLRCLNRLVELTPKVRITGDILFEGESIFGARIDPTRPAAAHRHGVSKAESFPDVDF